MSTNVLPEPIVLVIQEQANLMYDGQINSTQAFAVIDRAVGSVWNHYDGIFNDAREAFERQLDRRIDADLAEQAQRVEPSETYEAKELRKQLARGTFGNEGFFRLKVTGNRETRWINITPEQLDAIAKVLDA